jgi:hypothetical protein
MMALTRLQELRRRYFATRSNVVLIRYLRLKARLGRWDDRYTRLPFGKDPNVSPKVRAFIMRGYAAGLVTTSTTGGQHAPGSFHLQRDSHGRGRAADMGLRADLIGTPKGRARMVRFQADEFDRQRQTGAIELIGPANNLVVLRGVPVVLGEGTALEDQHDNHVHFGA